MQKISLTFAILTSFLVIIFLVQPMTQMVAVDANPFCNPIIFIESPSNYPADIYQTTSIPIEVEIVPYETGAKFGDIYYSLDGGPNTKLSVTSFENTTTSFGKGTLNNLTNGFHTLKSFSTDTQGNILSDSRTFLVNTTITFPTLLLSPTNTTYNSKEIPVTYTINESQYMVFYRLDNSGYTRLTGNMTLSGLTEGQHTISAHASNLTTGLYTKQTTNFTIDTKNPTPTPTPTVPEFSWLAILPFLLVMLTVAVVSRLRRKR